MKELSVVQKTYDCIKWYVPIIEGLPTIHKFTLADRMIIRICRHSTIVIQLVRDGIMIIID